MSMPSVRFTPSNRHSTLLLPTPLQYPFLFSFLFSLLRYTTKDNTVKEKGLQEVSILRHSLLQSFYASTAK